MSDEQGQRERWNGRAGSAWVTSQALLDRMMKPFEEVLLEGVSGERILDVGCGTGVTTVGATRIPGVRTCVGLDISEQMVDAARERAERAGSPATFVVGDAQTFGFEPAAYDLVMSRFGVMFFADPVAAFANLRAATRPGGKLRCITWRDAAENPFMTTAERAAAPLLPDLPVREPNEPGQFGLADREIVRRILTESGWTDIDIEPFGAECSFAEADLIRYVTQMGHVGIALAGADDQTRDRVVPVVRAAFEPFVAGDEVRFDAACWLIRARNTTS
ncbi:class I SAM-dependent methyltransferase [Nocardia sp. NPDC005978]|uniref:class I SAM-dependent methyltransferase n=1 Tax=Nocardia sp. NPDC005978 TaxID=3156725 RepID=UPI0033B579C9